MKSFSQYFFFYFIYTLILILLYGVAYQAGWVNHLPTDQLLTIWDARLYYSIVEKGYFFSETIPCNTAFFPFFPYLWKWSGLSASGISLLNGFIGITAISWLSTLLKPNKWLGVLTFSIPSMLFLFLPFTEAIFFFWCVVLLYGMQKAQKEWIIAGIFLASLSRPSMLFFIPAIVAVVVLKGEPEHWKSEAQKAIFWYILPALGGLSLVLFIHYWQTGEWLAFFKTEAIFWDKKLRPPDLPFGSMEGDRLLWLEALSFWVGITASVLMLYACFLKWKKIEIPFSRLFLFAATTLSMAWTSIVLFNPTWEINRTILSGINRYLFVNPFFYVIMWELWQKKGLINREWSYLILYCFLVWLLVDIYYLDPYRLLYVTALTVYILLMAGYQKTKNSSFGIGLIALNSIAQLWLFHQYLNGLWIG